MSARRPLLAVSAVLLTGGLVLAAPLMASAHVHIDPVQAEAGSATDVAFTVPNESDTASTTAVRITLPEGVGDVTAQSVRGWDDRVVTSGGRATAVEFTATGDGIGQGASQDLVVRLAQVPSVGSLQLPVAQTYSDGTVVEWDDPTPASGEEPEHPAPTLYVNDAPPAEDDHDGGTAATAEDDHHDAETASASSATGSALPLGLSAAALVVAVGALVVGVLALLRRR